MNNINLQAAAIVCEHIAQQQSPILSAFKTVAGCPEDSGWQFFCGAIEEESPDNAKIWLLGEVLDYEPSLSLYLGLSEKHCIWRNDISSDWNIGVFE